ncbi:MAG: DUF255 domain-containing protein [Saprospiraceae bacterium]|nr:DUF255 domain-containing protein [Saprospiraceae bacterium]
MRSSLYTHRFVPRMVLMTLIGVMSLVLHAQDLEIKWMSIEEVEDAMAQEPRKVMVDIYTDWCTWCVKMDQSTFQNQHIVKYINEHYYPVKFDAEQKEDLAFQSKTYSYVRNGLRGYHELAVELTKGRLSFPTVVFLDEELRNIQAIRGFQTALRFEQIMTYFANDYHKSTPWKRYSENYMPVLDNGN